MLKDFHATLRRRALATGIAMALAGAALGGGAGLATTPEEDLWPTLKEQVFGGREVVELADSVMLEAPYRA